MNYKKLWNDLKEKMIVRAEKAETELDFRFCRTDEILMAMVKAEVVESRKTEELENKIDLTLANLLGGNKNGDN